MNDSIKKVDQKTRLAFYAFNLNNQLKRFNLKETNEELKSFGKLMISL